MEVDAVTPGGAAPAWFPPPQPIVPAAEAEECTYEGVSREDGTWVADIKFDGEEIRLGTYENAGAAAWAYDAAREERGLPPVNFPLPGQVSLATEVPNASDGNATRPARTPLVQSGH